MLITRPFSTVFQWVINKLSTSLKILLLFIHFSYFSFMVLSEMVLNSFIFCNNLLIFNELFSFYKLSSLYKFFSFQYIIFTVFPLFLPFFIKLSRSYQQVINNLLTTFLFFPFFLVYEKRILYWEWTLDWWKVGVICP